MLSAYTIMMALVTQGQLEITSPSASGSWSLVAETLVLEADSSICQPGTGLSDLQQPETRIRLSACRQVGSLASCQDPITRRREPVREIGQVAGFLLLMDIKRERLAVWELLL